MSDDLNEVFYCGRRLTYDHGTCTVRYVGPVRSTSGSWLGVEWDDPTAGKHDGTYQGHRYFSCHAPSVTRGSFVRPNRPLLPPRSFLEAVRYKYQAQDGATKDGASDQGTVISGKVIEEVGFDRVRSQQATLANLRVVVINGLRVSGLVTRGRDPPAEAQEQAETVRTIQGTLPQVQELDLGRNLLESWAEVVEICMGLPNLRRLVLDGQRFCDFSAGLADESNIGKAFASISELSLNDTYIEWPMLAQIISPFKNLQSLQFNSNNLVCASTPLSLGVLKTISLSHNDLYTLEDIACLAELETLEELTLRACQLKSLTPIAKPFRRVRYLDLSYNPLRDIYALAQLPQSFPALTSLRIAPCPMFPLADEMGADLKLPNAETASRAREAEEEAHLLTIALLPSLTTLNYSRIQPKARTSAELWYLNRIAAELLQVNFSNPVAKQHVLEKHMRFQALCEQYGTPDTAHPPAEQPSSREDGDVMANRIVRLDLRLTVLAGVQLAAAQLPSFAANELENGATSSIVLSRNLIISRVKALIGTKFGVYPYFLRLIWETDEWDPVGPRPDSESEAESESEPGSGSASDSEPASRLAGIADEAKQADAGKPARTTAADAQVLQGSSEENPKSRDSSSWVRREVELIDGTRPLGFWIESSQAAIRVEVFR